MLNNLLKRGVAEVIVEEELKRLLSSNKTLRLKLGLDPSSPDIHLGHAVVLRKIRQFQELGHQAILIVGDWTAQIGDPSGQSSPRPVLSEEEVRQNAQTYMEQFFKIVDQGRTEVRWQSEWYGDFNLKGVFSLATKFTVAQLLAREDFQNRLASGNPVFLTEILYPLLQAYDSVVIKADVEFGGIDQKFNCLMGRELQGIFGQPPQQILLVPLLIGVDGRQKMSKSLKNHIGITDTPEDMYGKVMSLPDKLILPYMELVTDIPQSEIDEYRSLMEGESINPMEVKKRLAYEIVCQFHGADPAERAKKNFEAVFQQRQLPEDVPEFELSREFWSSGKDFIDLLIASNLVGSRSQGKRELSQGAVEVGGRRVTSIKEAEGFLRDGVVIRVGKWRFIRVKFGEKN